MRNKFSACELYVKELKFVKGCVRSDRLMPPRSPMPDCVGSLGSAGCSDPRIFGPV